MIRSQSESLPSQEALKSLNSESSSELPDDIFLRMPAARCPGSDSDEFDHWVLLPDDKSRGWINALHKFAGLIFAGTR